ncbi:DUF3574 domain-containing protein [Phenylobacterium sp.]|jgi:hypothetical protein|uniref:DUF3574 domain-containing protein n=1 Tax=Phenylobacterium sp. TaxID=1871053 RepID=UPI002F4001C6
MNRLGLSAGVAAALALAGCATVPETAPQRLVVECPVGQEARSTAQLFFGRNTGDRPAVSDDDFRRFVDTGLTPRFPEGLTVLDGGGQWRDASDNLIREASKVVLLVLPETGDPQSRVEAVRTAYKTRFHQDSVLLITQRSCVSF